MSETEREPEQEQEPEPEKSSTEFNESPIKICVVGTHQSGSTRLFNLIRLLYLRQGKNVFSGWNFKTETDVSMYDVVIGKIHDVELEYLDYFNFKFLPLRNTLDAAISHRIRRPGTTLLESCMSNITLFRKFVNQANMVFRYETYSVSQIRKLCKILGILQPSDLEIISIMKELEDMVNSTKIIEIDDIKDPEYSKTLLCKAHNSSGGKSNKFVYLEENEITTLLKDTIVKGFLEEHGYF